jgi:hypothetical protein
LALEDRSTVVDLASDLVWTQASREVDRLVACIE